MGGPVVTGTPARVRIKGRTASCVRFCLIAVSFMCPWVLVSSMLGYYSRWFGPQILLELSLAFNVPAIPVLILSGQVEKVLDRQLGPIQSMSVRLLFGLAGCTACCAIFPFATHTHATLLWLVAVLGMLSAIAFSTSYQLVQWFRHADIIALGIGGVGTGPLVLILQLCLEVGPNPQRWQWIAMFEITALVTCLGLVSATSLFAQYWKVLTGEEEYTEPHQPLLDAAQSDHEERREDRSMKLARMTTQHAVLPPDPMMPYGVTAMLTPGALPWPDEDEFGVPRLHSVASDGVPVAPGQLAGDLSDHRVKKLRPVVSLPGSLARTYRNWHAQHGHSDRWRHSPSPEHPEPEYGQGHPAWHAASADQCPGPHSQSQGRPPGSSGTDSGVCAEPGAVIGSGSAPLSQQPESAFLGADTELLIQALKEGGEDGDGSSESAVLSLREETLLVVRNAWQVLSAFSVSVIITYLVFPFFTYVKSSGLVGEELPKVLFFVRIFADLFGRFTPRIKVLMVHSPTLLSTIALVKTVLCVLFFVYLKAAPAVHHDVLSIAIILVIWLIGGYINTSANILAPALVPPAVVGRASALLALLFQVAHFAGLLLAVLFAYLLYGDVVG